MWVIKGITGFSRMYLHPFSREQSTTLIDNLLKGCDDKAIIESIKITGGRFLQRHKVFASNPMLLTFVIMKYPIVKSFDGKRDYFIELYMMQSYMDTMRKRKVILEYLEVFKMLMNLQRYLPNYVPPHI